MRLFTRRRAAALSTAAVLAAMGTLASAPGAVADDAGPWPGTEGKILTDGPRLIDPATGTATDPAVGSGQYGAWAPDGSRFATISDQTITSVRASGSTKITLPKAQGMRSGGSGYRDLAFGWSGRYVVFSVGGQLAYGPSDGSWAPEPLLSSTLGPSSACDSNPSVSGAGLVAFERRSGGCGATPGVYVYEPSTQTVKRVLTDAAQPVYSPDDSRLAFVRGGKIYTANADGTDVKQITTDARTYANPSWSPTGTRILADVETATGGGGYVHSTEYVDLATGAFTAVPTDWQGSNPSWQPLRKNTTARVWGADSYATAVASSRFSWNTVGQSEPGLLNAKAAVLVNQDDSAYSLTAPALAGKKQGPVLMTPRTGLSTAVKNELKRSLKKGATVWMLGGTSTLTTNVSTQLKALGYVPKRLSGTDRYDTSVKVAKAVTTAPTYVFLASGTDYKAALPAASAAGAEGTGSTGGLVLTAGKKLTASVKSYLNTLNPAKTMVIPVGSDAKYALTHTDFSHWPSTYYYYPVTATTSEGLSVALAKFWWGVPGQIALAYTGAWRDGISAGAAMNIYGPLVWTSRPALSSEVKSYLLRESAGTQAAVAFGPTASVTAGALSTAGASMSASGSQFVYQPFYNGVDSSTSTFAQRTAGSATAAATKSGRPTADPHLGSLKTVQHQ
ncbi:cell wall-binding repeat-containing protein [Streptomyces sp. NPDC057257]|uniref:cell wall-binding repeat-containing protein n=1 Tax=Streptomyces sp. NPDC057257 TaxID=3346071 RepID=UPI00363A8E35